MKKEKFLVFILNLLNILAGITFGISFVINNIDDEVVTLLANA